MLHSLNENHAIVAHDLAPRCATVPLAEAPVACDRAPLSSLPHAAVAPSPIASSVRPSFDKAALANNALKFQQVMASSTAASAIKKNIKDVTTLDVFMSTLDKTQELPHYMQLDLLIALSYRLTRLTTSQEMTFATSAWLSLAKDYRAASQDEKAKAKLAIPILHCAYLTTAICRVAKETGAGQANVFGEGMQAVRWMTAASVFKRNSSNADLAEIMRWFDITPSPAATIFFKAIETGDLDKLMGFHAR